MSQKPTSEPKLITAIRDSLHYGVMHESLPDALLSKDRSRLINKSEHDYWDYKQELPLGNEKAVSRFARDILGFHNAQGGVLVVGITDNGKINGLADNQIKDATFLQQSVQSYVGSSFPLFYDVIDLPNGRALWLVFVKSRGKNQPKACLREGPITGASGQREVRKNALYLRVHDQVRMCTHPDDLAKLFTGYSLAEMEAYTYALDEPYFRLLRPDTDVFVGRDEIVAKIDAALNLRHPIIALDGVGGAGKTATAIHVVNRYFEQNRFAFIVSLSAKHKLWHDDRTQSRRASFVGLVDFLREIASVLQVPCSDDIDQLEADVVSAMAGYKGLLLLDNLEEIDDDDLLTFISAKIPDPVKTIITSRIDKGLGAYTITIPEMTKKEATDLFCHQLEETELAVNRELDAAAIESVLEVTCCFPLALIWAAGVTKRKGSLAKAVEELKKFTASKNLFLEFCFRTMWQSLPETAQRIGMLRGYLGERCTKSASALILDGVPDREISAAIVELRDSGLLLSPTYVDELRVLSLTRDFMLKRWKDNAAFQKWAQPRIAAADENLGGALLQGKSNEERATAMLARASELSREGKWDLARRVIDLTLQGTSAASARFLAGKIRCEQGHREAGLQLMRENIDGDTEPADRLYVARQMSERGTDEDLRCALSILEPLVRDKACGPEARELALHAALRTHSIASLTSVLDIVPDDGVVATTLREISASLVDPAFLTRWGPNLLPMIERVERWTDDRAERTLMRNAIRSIRSVFGSPS